MVRIRVSMVIFFAAFAAVGQGQTMDPVTESFDVSGTPEIVVQNENGKTVVLSHAASTVEVVATKVVSRARDAAEAAQLADAVEVRIERRGDRIEVRTIYPDRRWFSWKDASVRVDIQVRTPRNSNLDLTSEDGALTVEGIEGVIRLNVEDGDLRVSDCAGELRIEAEDGDVRLESVRGEVFATVEDGDLDVQGSLTRLHARTEDGAIDIRLARDSVMEADWSVRADDGRIRLRLPEGFAAELNVRVDDGSIEIDQPVTVEGKFSNRELTTRLNGGGHKFEVRTSDGSVRISKS